MFALLYNSLGERGQTPCFNHLRNNDKSKDKLTVST